MGQSYAQKIQQLPYLLKNLVDFSSAQMRLLRKAIKISYKKKGISENPSSWDNKPPTFENVVDALYEMAEGQNLKENESTKILIDELSEYSQKHGGIYGFMSPKTQMSANFDKSNFLCFEFSNLSEHLKPVMISTALQFAQHCMHNSKKKVQMIFDEAHLLLKDPYFASQIEVIYRTGRKFKTSAVLISQTLSEFMTNSSAQASLTQSSIVAIFRQDQNKEAELIAKNFALTDQEARQILSFDTGNCMALINNSRFVARPFTSPKIHSLITSENLKTKK